MGTLIQNLLTNVGGVLTCIGTLVGQLINDLNCPPPTPPLTMASNNEQSYDRE